MNNSRAVWGMITTIVVIIGVFALFGSHQQALQQAQLDLEATQQALDQSATLQAIVMANDAAATNQALALAVEATSTAQEVSLRATGVAIVQTAIVPTPTPHPQCSGLGVDSTLREPNLVIRLLPDSMLAAGTSDRVFIQAGPNADNELMNIRDHLQVLVCNTGGLLVMPESRTIVVTVGYGSAAPPGYNCGAVNQLANWTITLNASLYSGGGVVSSPPNDVSLPSNTAPGTAYYLVACVDPAAADPVPPDAPAGQINEAGHERDNSHFLNLTIYSCRGTEAVGSPPRANACK